MSGEAKALELASGAESPDQGVEYEAVQDGCVQFSSPDRSAAISYANSEGPWAFSVYRVQRDLVWQRGSKV